MVLLLAAAFFFDCMNMSSAKDISSAERVLVAETIQHG